MNDSEQHHLFQNNYHALFTYAYRYVMLRVPHKQDAEDIVSLAFMHAYEHIEQYNAARGTMQQWLTGILKYRIIDYWRQQRIVLSIEDIELLNYVEKTCERDLDLDGKLLFEQLMKKLPIALQTLFILRYIDDFTYEQIATIVHKKPAAIRKTFSLLHKRLQTEFQSL